MATIFHLALASDWAAAQAAGAYTVSTRGRTLAEEGFIHASRGDQWPKVRERFYADVTEPLLLLQIDTDRLDVPVVEEPPAPGMAETFPHVYGPIPLDAVVRAMPLGAPERRRPEERGQREQHGETAARGSVEGSFGRYFLSEMFQNTTLVLLVMAVIVLGYAGGRTFGDDVAPFAGILLGAGAGVALARLIYVRRR